AEVVRAACWVSVATEPIAAWAGQYNPHVSVVPMAIDPRQYQPRSEPGVARPTLGWAGTAGGLRYLEALGPVLREVGLPVRVVSGGYQGVRLPGVATHSEPWRGPEQLKTFDIGLLPLDDSEFERAKFPFKLLQYMALSIPTVASRVGIAAEVIEDGTNGLLASSYAEWRAALQRLAADIDLRQRLGQAGRETVLERYTLDRVGPLLAEGLLSAARA